MGKQEKLLDHETRKKKKKTLPFLQCDIGWPPHGGLPPLWRANCAECSVMMRKQLCFKSGGWWSGKKFRILKACVERWPLNWRHVRNVFPVWLSEGPLSLPLSFILHLSLAVHLPQPFGKLKTAERMVHKLLYKSGRIAKGLLKPLGHHNAYPIHHIDFPFFWQISQPCQRKEVLPCPLVMIIEIILKW